MTLRNLYSSLAVLALAGSSILSSISVAHADCVKGVTVPEGGDYSDWPELFRLTSPNPEDPTLSNMDETAGPVDPSVLLAAGVGYIFLDPTGFTYPDQTAEIPWSPPANGTNDMALQELRDESDYQYADIVVVTAYNEKFYEEHIHAGGDEVRYVIDGSGYFDIRDVNDEWVRMHATAGAFIIFPSGIEHRFAVDDNLYIQAMRLFPGSGEPDWSSVPRVETLGNVTARNEYVDTYLCGIDPDLDHEHEHEHSKDHGEDDGEAHSEDHDHDHSEEETAEMESGASSRGSFVMGAMALAAGLVSLAF